MGPSVKTQEPESISLVGSGTKRSHAKLAKTAKEVRNTRISAAKLAKLSFEEWVKKTSPNLDWDARHLGVLFGKLEKMTKGHCDRLMVFMPPRHGKSETVTVHYAAWRMEQDPTTSVIIGSHSQKLADRFLEKGATHS